MALLDQLKKKKDDLFDESTMSFGDHLEELRQCLWRALWWVVGGFVIGLLFGSTVVRFIQTPLKSALMEYYQKRAEDRVDAQMNELLAMGYGQNVATIPKKLKMYPEEVYIFPDQLATQFGLETRWLDPDKNRDTDTDRAASSPKGEAPETDSEKSKEGGTPNDSETSSKPDKKDENKKAEKPLPEPVQVLIWKRLETDSRIRTTALNAQEAFTIFLKASLLVGLLIASPGIFYNIWAFVAAGLYPHEKKYVHVFLPISLGLFLGGAALAFFVVFQFVLRFLFKFNDWLGIDPDPRISEWLSFVLFLPLGFGISFQLPLVMLFLERIGLFTVESYLAKWRMAVLVILAIAMFLTPSDPWSMMLMAAPLTLLYFGGVGMCKYFPRRQSIYDDALGDEEV